MGAPESSANINNRQPKIISWFEQLLVASRKTQLQIVYEWHRLDTTVINISWIVAQILGTDIMRIHCTDSTDSCVSAHCTCKGRYPWERIFWFSFKYVRRTTYERHSTMWDVALPLRLDLTCADESRMSLLKLRGSMSTTNLHIYSSCLINTIYSL